MPLPIIPKSLYPLVPQALGVPALLRSGAQLLDTLTLGYLGIGDALNEIIGAEPVKWGVFDSTGKKIAPYDSVVAVGYQNDSHVSDYPIEGGAFATYNKVESPFGVVVALNCGGSEENRANFQTAIEAARKSLDRFTVLTPDHTYYDINFTGVSWSRSLRDGAYMITCQLTGREIRDFAKAAYATPKDIGAFDPKAQGQIQLISDPTLDASGIA
jgi:hypothetical protein